MNNTEILDPNTLTKFIDSLPIPEILKPNKLFDPCTNYATSNDPLYQEKKPLYIITMLEGFHKLHSQIPLTKLWKYNGSTKPLQIENERYNDIYVLWKNELPLVHLLTIDHSLDGAGLDVPLVRNVTHLHGALTAAYSDGGPLEWFVPGQSALYHYPNVQPPTMLFWHDHAMGITRLNTYAGLSGGVYMIREPEIEKCLNLPSGKYEIPLLLTDRTFDMSGQIVYNDMWMSHFLGNTILVNTMVWPYLNVKPTRYRFRIVNDSDTRTYGLRLLQAPLVGTAPSYVGSIEGPKFVQIGSDGGYLPKPIVLNGPLIIGIGERMDIIVDFSNSAPGTEYILVNNANGTFPNGNPPDANTSQVMKFNVIEGNHHKFSIKIPHSFVPLDPKFVSKKRQHILNTFPIIGAADPMAIFLNNTGFMEPATETPKLYSTEMWTFVNLTRGMHPIHLHLIQFQLYNRQQYRFKDYQTDLLALNPGLEEGMGIPNKLDVTPYLIGDPIFPQGTNEYAWKDVIQVSGSIDPNIGFVTRILVKFAPQLERCKDKQKFPFDATKGEYMWHCHIKSHEDNEMMRPIKFIDGKKCDK